MPFVFGRNNLALTVFVPYDCKNGCPFCTSKKTYTEKKPNKENVIRKIRDVFTNYNYPIKDVVFTGGEPMEDVETLKELIDCVPYGHNVYINTTLTNNNLNEFIELVNKNNKIQGVNISRHGESIEEDREMLHDAAEDCEIERIEKNVRINCLVANQNLKNVIDRWKKRNITLSFRRDFTKPFFGDLHDPYDSIAMTLVRAGCSFVGHTQCNVCDTTEFKADYGLTVLYHKGEMRTSIQNEYYTEINDLIIDQSGEFMYDWADCDPQITLALEKEHKKRNDFENVSMERLMRAHEYTVRVCGRKISNYVCGNFRC